jgi:hypothetical protein
MSFRTFVFLLALPIVAQAGAPPQGVNFSNYDVPLYTQIVDRIKDRVSARLGEGKNMRDRYFIMPFAYQEPRESPGTFTLVSLCHPGVCGQQAAQTDARPQNGKVQDSGI